MKKYCAFAAILGVVLLLPLCAEEVLTTETYASYYGEAFNGKPTSSGELFDMNAYTAAHKTLPFGTFLEVTNLENGKKVVVRVNDRGPFVANRELDLSKAAAESLGMVNKGITRVAVKKVDSLEHAALVAINDTYAKQQTTSTRQPASSDDQPEAVPVQTQQAQTNQTSTQQMKSAEAQEAPAQQVQPQQTQQTKAETQDQQDGREEQPTDPSPKKEMAKQTGTKAMAPQKAGTKQTQPADPVYIPTNSEETPGVLWRIQLGAFTREENALRLVVGLRKAGLEPAYERTETAVRVVLPGIRPSDLDNVKRALSEYGFSDYVIRQESW